MGPQGVSTNQQHLRCWQWDHPRDPKSKLYPFHTLKKDFHCDWLLLQKHVDRVMTDVKRERLFWREPESWRFLLDEQCRITLCDWCSDSCEKVREILRNLTRESDEFRHPNLNVPSVYTEPNPLKPKSLNTDGFFYLLIFWFLLWMAVKLNSFQWNEYPDHSFPCC